MEEPDATDSPLEAIAGTAGSRATEAFSILGNETRLSILLALWENYEPFEQEVELPFSTLRERLGRPDSGQFNYHLGKLEGQFVESTEHGYKLNPAGDKVTRVVFGWAGTENPSMESTELGIPCVQCDAPTAITYRDSRLIQHCTQCRGHFGDRDELPEGTLYAWRFEPAGLSNRTPREVFTAACNAMFNRVFNVIDGVCPECSGTIETDIAVCDTHEPDADGVCTNCGRGDQILAYNQCSVCKYASAAAPSDLVTHHPAVISFYYDHGIDIQYDLDFEELTRLFELEKAHEETIESMDPLRVRVTVQYERDEISLRFDEDMTIIEVIE